MSNSVNKSEPPIGVIGLGDLGRRVVAQQLLSNQAVMVSDPMVNTLWVKDLRTAIDPSRTVTSVDEGQLRQENTATVLERCEIVHWAVPSDKLIELPQVPDNCTVVLHDSVMSNSVAALKQRADNDQFVLAHCLMNDAKRVLVSTEYGNHQAIFQHLENIGLSPKPTTAHEHDVLMARTQGVFALLIKLGIRTELDAGFAAGDLTPSAEELHSAVANREANWTTQTLHSILSNPELAPFVQEMADLLAEEA